MARLVEKVHSKNRQALSDIAASILVLLFLNDHYDILKRRFYNKSPPTRPMTAPTRPRLRAEDTATAAPVDGVAEAECV